ncbi:hypothetical protein DFA_10234 [Cavenderia fasciculata]|uniref:Fibronectin type-III domain-containing protein n=1 Tax=Cavenderia fasciculata TaxID=261658 RepID=F4Q9N0_CACFS|nr:uncharacterized protein DFA_10234 [Cavenderia fasciculata]EGG15399.1 hypothetical protein DFA_10234 [Cavenderia fasciculata]|eukprot:XP_004354141.1 hypothetical protein DFA_10234 [Cavenderia fasciculata]
MPSIVKLSFENQDILNYVTGQCYIKPSGSFKIEVSGGSIVRSLYANDYCSGAPEITKSVAKDVCDDGNLEAPTYIRYVSAPVYPTPGFNYYEHYISNCNADEPNSARVLVADNLFLNCVSNDELTAGLYVSAATDSQLEMNIYSPAGCSMGGTMVYTKACQLNAGGVTRAQRVTAIFSLTPSYYVSGSQIIVTSVTSNYPNSPSRYNFFYYNGGWQLVCQAALTCTISGIPQSTGLRVELFGQPVIGGIPSWETATNQINLPATMNSLSLISYTTKQATISYSGTYVSNYVFSLNGGAHSGCPSQTTCVISGSPGQRLDIGVAAQNAAGVSAYQYTSVTLYQSVSIPTITSISSTTNSVSLSWSASLYGVPGLTTYTVKFNGITFTPCQSITSLSCTVTGLAIGTSYTMTVTATNDGTSVNGPGTPISTFAALSDPSITASTTKTKSITVTYAPNGGDSSKGYTWVVLRNGQQVYSGSNTQTVVTGLSPNTAYTIRVQCTNDGTTKFVETSLTTVLSIHTPSITLSNVLTKTMLATFGVGGGGVVGDTRYTVTLNGSPTTCTSQTTTTCSLTGLTPNTLYTVSVSISNDGDSLSKDAQATTVKAVNTPTLALSSITTKSMIATYGSSDGVVGSTRYTVSINGTNQVGCINVATTTCTLINLVHNTYYLVRVTVTNNGDTILSEKVQPTWKDVSQPLVQITQVKSGVLIEYSSTDGIPNQTVYQVYVNNALQESCPTTTAASCLYSTFSPGDSLNIRVVATNDDDTQTTTSTFYTYTYPSQVQIANNTLVNDISINWTSSTGGFPKASSYSAFISFDGVHFILDTPNCQNITVDPMECHFSGLVSDTNYFIRVSVINTDFEWVNTTIETRTLRDTPKSFICQSASDCSNNGECLQGSCECNAGWNGLICNAPKPTDQQDVIVKPVQDKPLLEVTINGVSYEFSLVTITEKTMDDESAFIMSLANETWALDSSQTNITVNHPIDQSQLIKNQWTYSLLNTSDDYSISIVFILYEKKHDNVDGSMTNSTLDTYPYEFAGDTFNVKYGSLKYSLKIKKWNFKSVLNTLEISTTLSTPKDNCGNTKSAAGGQLPTITNTNEKTTLITLGNEKEEHHVFGKLINRALLDSIPKKIYYKTVEPTDPSSSSSDHYSLLTLVPYFSKDADLDPDFSLLLQTNMDGTVNLNDCSGSNAKNLGLIVGLSVGLISAAGIGIGSTIYFKKLKLQRQLIAKLNAKLSRTTTPA